MNCSVFEEGRLSTGSFALGALFFVGMLASFVPQLHKIRRRRTPEGISAIFAFCSASMALLNFEGSLMTQLPKLLSCCPSAGGGDCAKLSAPMATLGLQATCTAAVLSLCAYFGAWRRLVALFAVLALAATATTVGMLASGADSGDVGDGFGVAATALTCVQFFPQLWTTWRLKSAGSFSLLTLAIQAPGSVGWALYLATASSPVSTWMPPAVTGACQTALLVLCVLYERAGRRQGDGGTKAEREGLLLNS